LVKRHLDYFQLILGYDATLRAVVRLVEGTHNLGAWNDKLNLPMVSGLAMVHHVGEVGRRTAAAPQPVRHHPRVREADLGTGPAGGFQKRATDER